jgi:2-methylcitrate dehydratase PrpD
MNPTETLASYIAVSKFSDFPEEVVSQAKRCILDSIGCALGGSQTELGQQYIKMAKNLEGKPESTVIGDGARVSCMNGAYTNTLLCNALDFDDTYLYTPSHPGGTIVHTALSVADIVAASGVDIITAVVLGYEASLRIGCAIRSVVSEEGRKKVMYNSSFPVFGSATAAAKLWKLNEREINSAFGIAGTIAPGAPKGTWQGGTAAKLGEAKLDYHMQAFLGTFAAWQAQEGLSGPQDILDGDIFWTRSGANSCNYLELTRGLGEKYRIMEVGFKPAASCRFSHHSITAVWKALEGASVKAEDIEEIVLTQVMPMPAAYEWETMVQAQFSLPCAVALSIAGGEPGPNWYKNGRFKDPDVRELARKIKFVEDAKSSELWLKYGKLTCTAAKIKTKDGKARRAFIEYPKGEPENPLTEEELKHKFMINAVGILGQRQAEELGYRVLHLEEVDNSSALTSLLYPED